MSTGCYALFIFVCGLVLVLVLLLDVLEVVGGLADHGKVVEVEAVLVVVVVVVADVPLALLGGREHLPPPQLRRPTLLLFVVVLAELLGEHLDVAEVLAHAVGEGDALPAQQAVAAAEPAAAAAAALRAAAVVRHGAAVAVAAAVIHAVVLGEATSAAECRVAQAPLPLPQARLVVALHLGDRPAARGGNLLGVDTHGRKRGICWGWISSRKELGRDPLCA